MKQGVVNSVLTLLVRFCSVLEADNGNQFFVWRRLRDPRLEGEVGIQIWDFEDLNLRLELAICNVGFRS